MNALNAAATIRLLIVISAVAAASGIDAFFICHKIFLPRYSFNYDKAQSSASMGKIARVLDEKHAQLWINHDKPASDARRHLPEFYQ